MEHDWSGWPEDEPQFGDAYTADLDGGPGALGEFGGEHGGPSPFHEQGPSPFHEQGPSPFHEQGPSPFHEQGPSPFHEQGPSPFDQFDQRPDYAHDYGAPVHFAESSGEHEYDSRD